MSGSAVCIGCKFAWWVNGPEHNGRCLWLARQLKPHSLDRLDVILFVDKPVTDCPVRQPLQTPTGAPDNG